MASTDNVVFGEEDDLGYQVALAGDRLMVFPEVTAKALGMGRGFRLIEAGHRPRSAGRTDENQDSGGTEIGGCSSSIRRWASWTSRLSASSGPLPTSCTDASNFPRSFPLTARTYRAV